MGQDGGRGGGNFWAQVSPDLGVRRGLSRSGGGRGPKRSHHVPALVDWLSPVKLLTLSRPRSLWCRLELPALKRAWEEAVLLSRNQSTWHQYVALYNGLRCFTHTPLSWMWLGGWRVFGANEFVIPDLEDMSLGIHLELGWQWLLYSFWKSEFAFWIILLRFWQETVLHAASFKQGQYHVAT